MSETNGLFYLGRLVNEKEEQQPYHLDPNDLTTHAFVVGMTGSGKTGLGLGLLEEAALRGTPALMIDPKGDITNALLHFPHLAPTDFQPWVSAAEAQRQGKTVTELAAATAVTWRDGLASWGIQPERIQQLADSAQFAVYTPGSEAGLKVSILASLAAPDLPWEANQEVLREQISSTVTAVLGLIGLKDIDPVRSREHILLANIFEHHWRQGQDLDLATLIMQVQAPPFAQLGVFDVNVFFPEKERFALAMLLNNILAAPTFQSWIEGEPLAIEPLLYTHDGRPRHTIFYIAHLPEDERMFFVTLLFGAVETWMRQQGGVGSLRALIYFDEIFGYLPPIANPPSKAPMLRLLKQARAFGVGLVLATQNPADMDYKALSNMGAWFVGKLATDQDKQRLLDGLIGAAAGGLDRRELDDLISRLDKRVFLARNVHERAPALFRTRWAMNYLAGPLTRDQIPALNHLAGAAAITAAAADVTLPTDRHDLQDDGEGPALAGGPRPALPAGIHEYFLPQNRPAESAAVGVLYQPLLLAQAHITVRNRKFNVDTAVTHAILTEVTDPDGRVRWAIDPVTPFNRDSLQREPAPLAQFGELPPALSNLQTMRRMQQDFIDWLYQHKEIAAQANEALSLYAGPDVPASHFRQLCLEAVQPKIEAETQKAAARHARQIEALRQKLAREQRELADDQAELSHRKQKEALTHARTVFGIFGRGRGRRLEQSQNQRRQTQKAETAVKASEQEIAALQQELERLETEKAQELAAIRHKWLTTAETVTAVSITPFKKDIDPDVFGVAWFPYHLIQTGGQVRRVPGYNSQALQDEQDEIL